MSTDKAAEIQLGGYDPDSVDGRMFLTVNSKLCVHAVKCMYVQTCCVHISSNVCMYLCVFMCIF